ncbi:MULTISPECIES: CueP family metal-binding protein [unclassified Microbacterium]|uniref:CueP family metal-binding protein n=1 Tax=unclassified Microbacterium TaxID=2609290 RepID=UPI0006895B0F|nr:MULTISPECIES: CueP family metal-binding protein [unclassified Microbacterium]
MNHPLPSTTSPASPSVSASPRRRRLSAGLAALAVAGIALSGCAPAVSPADVDSVASARDLLAAHDLVGLDVGEVIERLDAMPVADRPDDLLASVEPDALLLRDTTGRESRLPMPDDAVYISVAPFREQTHECHFHSLTTCVGELSDTEMRIVLTADDGTVLIDEMRRTHDNGFTGVWVPRGIEATLTVESAGLTGTVPLSTTSPDDRTCVTDLQLL